MSVFVDESLTVLLLLFLTVHAELDYKFWECTTANPISKKKEKKTSNHKKGEKLLVTISNLRQIRIKNKNKEEDFSNNT